MHLPSLTELSQLRFASPVWLAAVLFLPAVFWLRSRRRVPVLVVPFAGAWHRDSRLPAARLPVALTLLGVLLVITSLARPQRVEDKRDVHAEGYDLVLAIDLSTSMLSEDYERAGERINRLQAIKPVIEAFVHNRPNDRIGLVVFSGRAYTLSPLTFDHDWLSRQLERLTPGLIEDGTAIGDGLGVALSRLEQARREKGGHRQGAFIVLLTDGANNKGSLAPLDAADIGKARNIPVYTIGAGKEGYVPVPQFDRTTGRRIGTIMGLSDLDEGTLREIASRTGGKFFRADDSATIKSAFASIDAAQKIEFEAKSYLLTTELFAWFLWPGLAFVALGAVAGVTRRAKETTKAPSQFAPLAGAPAVHGAPASAR